MDDDLKEFEVDLHLSTADHEGRPISEFTKQVKVDKWQGLVLQPSNKELICVWTSWHIYIYNSSTNEFIELPDHHRELQPLPPMTLFGVGFGFVPSTMDYKVVRLVDIHLDYENFDEYEISCEVLTISSCSTIGSNNSSSYSWRVIEGGCPYPVFDLSLAIDKFAIWKVNEWFVGAQERDEVIFCFNLETEKFSAVPPPHCVTNQIEFRLAVLKVKGIRA